MANSGIVVINAVYNDGYGESVGRQGPPFTVGDDLFDCSKGYSPLGVFTAEISVLSIALTSLQIDPSHFFSSCSNAFDMCKTALIYSNAKRNF